MLGAFIDVNSFGNAGHNQQQQHCDLYSGASVEEEEEEEEEG